MKKFLSVFLVFAFVIGVCFSAPFTLKAIAAEVDNLSFELNNNGESYYVSDCNESVSGDLEIPSTYNGLPVTSIGDEAFRDCTSLTSVTIPDSVTSIGDRAFYNCRSLSSITIGESVTSIGSDAFVACTSLTSITIPESVTSIGDRAFHYCTTLTSITIPDSVTSIGSDAFIDCTSLTSVNITNLAAWCNIDFGNSVANPLYYAENLYLSNSLQKNLLIPEGVTEIKPYAFYNCKSIISIKLPKSLKKVGSDAFYGCSNIEMVETSDLTAWCNIDFGDSDANPLYYAGDLYLNGKLVTELQIPEGVTQIKKYAFYNCSSLTSITIPDSVTSIGCEAFRNCTSLTSVNITNLVAWCDIDFGDVYANPLFCAENFYLNGKLVTELQIPEGVTQIKKYAFRNCTSLTSIIIPESVTSISDRAFSDCTSLTSIIIGDNVTSIGDYAFYDCTSLKYVFYPGSSADWNKISIGSNNSKLTSSPIHYNTTDHSCSVVKNLPFFEGMEGSVEEICSVCGFINSSKKLTFVNSCITAVDTKNVVLDTEADMLLLDISACTDISDAIIEMDGYTITAIPNSSHGFIGTGSKLKVSTTSGTQVAEYTLVVRGDVNGDSVCDVLDCMLVELARNNQTTLEGAYYVAANLAEDDQIDMNDYSAVVNRVFA